VSQSCKVVLALDAMWQFTLAFFWHGMEIPVRGRAAGSGEVKIYGQVLLAAKKVTYRIWSSEKSKFHANWYSSHCWCTVSVGWSRYLLRQSILRSWSVYFNWQLLGQDNWRRVVVTAAWRLTLLSGVWDDSLAPLTESHSQPVVLVSHFSSQYADMGFRSHGGGFFLILIL